ncbi:hypothetical protein GIB67_003375 [Kingdonia uniflora]|uniref:Ubiquitin-like protease family profile domain-containing protein n=1 Tax=Kingdonia uniflora TaxID=39325 RepID=A0A7J7P8X4_9MAGN|nr:hypothetical protein GIB67_003375 [Kingdonia uniflora]
MSTVGDNTLSLGNTPLLGQYQFSTPEKTIKRKQEGENLFQQVAPGEGLEVVKYLMVDDDVEINLEAISSEYGGSLLKNVKFEEEQPQVAEEEDSEPPTVVVYYNRKKDVQHANETMVVAEVAKTDIVFFNQEEVGSEAYQASANQTTAVSVEKQTLDVENTEDEASQFVFMESEVDVTLKKRHTLTEDEINERAFKMACRMNQLYAHIDELFSGVLIESFIQRPISKDVKNKVDQVWSLRKVKLSPKTKKDNNNTFMMIGEETVYLNALYTLYPKQWLDNEVIYVYIKALIQYFDTQHRAHPDKERIMLADVFAYQYMGRAFNVWTRNMSSPESVNLKKKVNLGINYIYSMGSYNF